MYKEHVDSSTTPMALTTEIGKNRPTGAAPDRTCVVYAAVCSDVLILVQLDSKSYGKNACYEGKE
jgi:hypothetical protein